jgi:peptidyl-prolyl cis-trans isomerase C
MIRRPLLLLSLLALLGSACKRDAETPGAASPDTAGKPASTDPANPAAPGTAPGTAQKPQPQVDPTKFPDVVARVGKDSISRTDLLNAARQAVGQAAQAGAQPPPQTLEFFRQVLDSLVVRQLLYVDAKAQGITANEAEVTRRIAEIRKNFPDTKKFAEALAAQGLTEKGLADNARVILSVDRYVVEKFAPAVQVPEATIRSYYDTHPNEMKVAERRRVRHILIRPESEDPAAKGKAAKLAGDLLARLKKGEDFAALASQYSADPGSKGNGGELPPIGRGETVPPFEQAAWALAKGQTSGVVESPFGFHLIQLIDVVPASTVPYDQVRGRLEQFLRQRDLKQTVRTHADQLRAKTKVEVLI